LVKEAFRSFKKKRYRDTAIILEKAVSSGVKEPYAFFLLALSYLFTDRLHRVDETLRRVRIADPNFLPGVQMDLFLGLKSAEDAGVALSRYMDGLQRFPKDRLIQRAVRALQGASDFGSFQRRARLQDFVYIPRPGAEARSRTFTPVIRPRSAGPSRRWVLLAVLVPAAILCIVYFFLPEIRSGLARLAVRKEVRRVDFSKIDMISLDGGRYDLIDRIGRERTAVFYYSNEEVLGDFQKARSLLKGEKQHEALVLINRLLNSNANFTVKERAMFLREFLMALEERQESPITFTDAAGSPYLYKGAVVRWRGRVANLKRKDGKMLFHLLVDYSEKNRFAGVAEVYSGKDYAGVSNGSDVETRAVFNSTLGSDDRIYLVAEDVKIVR
jgi:hypothetical protein